jgi:carboxylesterase type B
MHSSLLFIAIWQGFNVAALTTSVQIDAGTLLGGVCSNTDAVYYKSIPYARPPVGNLRFAAPQPYREKYPGGKRNATKPAPACIQFGSAFSYNDNNSEDWSVSSRTLLPLALTNQFIVFTLISGPRPMQLVSQLVLFVHGSMAVNTAGGISDPLYDGCNVPSTGAIMVSLSYRIGPLGFLALESAGIGGNQAIEDLLLGLEWIKHNIAAFGGDPKRVMLHGQSAGAVDSFTVATLPQAPSLINGVILQSGGGRDAVLKDHAEALGEAYALGLNCSVTNVCRSRQIYQRYANFSISSRPVSDLYRSPRCSKISILCPY